MFSISTLLFFLIILVFLSGFFSSSEIGMMSINRYKLRHWAKRGIPAAKRVSNLLSRPDKLLGVILIGNTFANILASAIATLVAVRLFGEAGVWVATFLLTLVILIFAEIAPKSVAARYPQKIAFFASRPLSLLLGVLYPFVWLANILASWFLRCMGVRVNHTNLEKLTRDELKTMLTESAQLSSNEQKDMLVSMLDISKMTVDEIMVDKDDIVGLDLDDDMGTITDIIDGNYFNWLPVYRGTVNNVFGMLNTTAYYKQTGKQQQPLNKDKINLLSVPIAYYPTQTPLHTQIENFKRDKARIGLVVDEYGDVLGLITLTDVIQELMGHFESPVMPDKHTLKQSSEHQITVSGNVVIRDLNHKMNWQLPKNGPKTVGGLTLEYLEFMPRVGTCLKIENYVFEVLEVESNSIAQVSITKQSS